MQKTTLDEVKSLRYIAHNLKSSRFKQVQERLNNFNKYKMTLETEIYQILRKHRLGLKKREELIVDLLDFIDKREKQLTIPVVVGRSEQLKCDHINTSMDNEGFDVCDDCGKDMF